MGQITVDNQFGKGYIISMNEKTELTKRPEDFTAGIMDVQIMFPGLTDANRNQYQDRLCSAIWEMMDKHFPDDVEAMRGKKYQFMFK